MQTLTQTLIVFLHSLLAWSGLAVYFLLARGLGQASGLPRLAFILGHYLLVVIFFSGVYYFYFSYFDYFSAFTTMVIALISVFVVELVVFNFFYTGKLWFLNFVDYIVPVFLAAGSVYFVGKFFG
jgi:hypothetical protein